MKLDARLSIRAEMHNVIKSGLEDPVLRDAIGHLHVDLARGIPDRRDPVLVGPNGEALVALLNIVGQGGNGLDPVKGVRREGHADFDGLHAGVHFVCTG